MTYIDFNNDKRFGAFGVISKDDYNSLSCKEQKEIDKRGYETIRKELDKMIIEIDKYDKLEKSVIVVN